MKRYQVGIIGGTGMVGQRFVTLLENHPWFQPPSLPAPEARESPIGRPSVTAGLWIFPALKPQNP